MLNALRVSLALTTSQTIRAMIYTLYNSRREGARTKRLRKLNQYTDEQPTGNGNGPTKQQSP